MKERPAVGSARSLAVARAGVAAAIGIVLPLLVACASGGQGPSDSQSSAALEAGPAIPQALVDPCAHGGNDNQFEVPEWEDLPASRQLIRISTQDTYWYSLYHSHHKGCDRLVVDIKMNQLSGRHCTPDGHCTWAPVYMFSDAYNLPSSAGWFHDGTTPGTVRDCNAYEMHTRYYEKLAGETEFDFLTEKTFVAEWVNGACKIIPTPIWGSGIDRSGEFKSQEWDTYRVATKVLLRGLPQQARVIAEARQPLPK